MPDYTGGHRLHLLGGGDELFPALEQALAAARHEVWLATYIYHDDQAGRRITHALAGAAERGVQVHVLVDGFGSNATIARLRQWFAGTAVELEVFRPLERWWAWLQPGQLRRLHQKLCAVDGVTAFVGGINIIDDRFDIHHGRTERPRLDFAVQLDGPLAADVQQVVRSLFKRAALGRGWREEALQLARSAEPVQNTMALLRDLRSRRRGGAGARTASAPVPPVRAALVVRDNLRQRRTIERAYIEAIFGARERIDIACPYFYPGRPFLRALYAAAARGVRVRLLLQGKVDYRIAALAARVQYDEMLRRGLSVYEYTPAFLHAKVALIDRAWATVGSSNIDPLSLLLNLEANVVVDDEAFVAHLGLRLDAAFTAATEVQPPPQRRGWQALRQWGRRGLVAWMANTYLRLAGLGGRY